MELIFRGLRNDDMPACWPRTLLLVPDAIALAWAGMWFGLKFKGRIRAILGSLLLVLLVPWLMTLLLKTVSMTLQNSMNLNLMNSQNFEDWQTFQIVVLLASALLMDLVIVLWAISSLPKNFRQLAIRR
jgi:hypothetical protein